MFPGYCSKRMSLRASAHTGVALSKDSLRSQSVSPLAPTLGELAAKPTERVKFALSAPFRGHLSHRERQVTLIRHGYAVPPSPLGKALGNGLPRRPMASSQ